MASQRPLVRLIDDDVIALEPKVVSKRCELELDEERAMAPEVNPTLGDQEGCNTPKFFS